MNRTGPMLSPAPRVPAVLSDVVRRPHVPRAAWLVVGLLAGVAALAALVTSFGAFYVLAALVAAALAATLIVWPEGATLLVVFLLYVNFAAILTKQHGAPDAVAGSFILLLGVPLVHHVIAGRGRLKADTAFHLMVLLLLVYAASSFAAIDTSVAVGRIWLYLLEGLLLYWLMVNVIPTVGTLRRVIWTVLAAGSLLSLLCIYQDVTGDYRQEFGGMAYRNFVTAPEEEEEAMVVSQREGRETWNRAQGPVNEPNRFAQIMIVLLPLAVFMHRTSPAAGPRLAAAGAGVLILIGTLLTLSRGAIVTLLLMTLAMAAVRWVRASHVATGAAVIALAVPIVTPFFIPRVLSIFNAGAVVRGDADVYRDGAVLGRTTSMLTSLNVFLDHPVLGVGLGQYSRFYSLQYSRDPDVQFRQLREPRRAHTLYFEVAAETGALGLVAFLSIVGYLLRRLWAARRALLEGDRYAADLATALSMSLIAYLITALFLHLSYQRYYWFLIALASAALHVIAARRPRADAASAAPITRTPRVRRQV